MTVAVVSDIHANMEALEAVLNDLGSRDYEGLLCAGDLVGYNARPNAVVDRLREENAVCVRGNHDAAVVEVSALSRFNALAREAARANRKELRTDNLRFLEELPSSRMIETEGRQVHMVHGSPRDPMWEYVDERKVDRRFLQDCFVTPPDILVLGHTHVPFVKEVGETLVLNPGSVGQPRDGDQRASYAIIDSNNRQATIERVGYDVEAAARRTADMIDSRLGDRLYAGR